MNKESQKIIKITQPLLPPLQKVNEVIKKIWDSGWVTNHGKYHNQLEDGLKKFLRVPNLSIFNNGTIALLAAIKALDLPKDSEIITTPFTFPATPHAISWNGLKPVFCDIDQKTMCIDADKIEKLITPNTSAILAVHVYGYACNVYKIEEIAKKFNLKVIYDAAHAFNVQINGKAIGTFGDISMFSFHATKLFNTIEGGCLTFNSDLLQEKIYLLRNFGIKNEEEVCGIGINGKMNEIQAAIGLLNLELVEDEVKKRRIIFDKYVEKLSNLDGILLMDITKNCTNSFQYFVIRINKEKFCASRNEIHDQLKKNNILSRKYFYPLCSDYDVYKNLESSKKEHLFYANQIKDEVLCLPFYGDLKIEEVTKICDIIKNSSNNHN
jgi:dTDP-4-amino-4,6-dideoxygalactose transaminase